MSFDYFCSYSSGLTCPAADFVEESFFQIVKDTLSEEGLFVINLVSRSSAVKDMVVSRMKAVRIENVLLLI
jgi:spermidine synthase